MDVDLWNFKPRESGSIRDALNYLVPYAKADKEWTRKEISGVDSGLRSLKELMHKAGSMFDNETYRSFATDISEEEYETILTFPQ